MCASFKSWRDLIPIKGGVHQTAELWSWGCIHALIQIISKGVKQDWTQIFPLGSTSGVQLAEAVVLLVH